MSKDERDAYGEALVALLGIPPIVRELEGALRVAQYLFKPSFHPECSISVIERATDNELVLRAPGRSIWQFVREQQAPSGALPKFPVLSLQRVPVLDAQLEAYRAALMTISDEPTAESTILDGMAVEAEIVERGRTRQFRTRRFNPLLAEARLVHEVVRLAREVVAWETSQRALEGVEFYFQS